jgi:DNA-binding SARP family transcriptional activator
VGIEFGVLGSLEVRRDGVVVDRLTAKQRALLAVLLVHANEVVSVDRLVDGLWPAHPPATANGVVQTYVSRLRKGLEPARLVTVEPGYRLVVDADELDAARFEALLGAGRAALLDGDVEAAARRLWDGLGLWRGPALADVGDAAELRAEALRLDELRMLAVEARVDADLALGRHGELVAELERLVAEHPLRERLWAQLMLSLYRSGRQAAALAAGQQLRQALREELGLEPTPEIPRLEHDILTHAVHLRWAPSAAAAVPMRVPPARSNLPASGDADVFVGREEELAALEAWWGDPGSAERLAIVLGESGIGKTRLAIAFGQRVERAGDLVLYGRALEAGGSPYEPVLSALRQFVVQAGEDAIDRIGTTAAAALTRLLPELGERRPDLAARAATWGDVDRSWLLSTVAGCLDHHPTSPTLLVLDDVQWADRPALLLLSLLLAADRPVRVLATCRHPGGFTGSQFANLLAELRRDNRPVRRVSLGGLTDDEIAALVDAIGDAELRRCGPGVAAAIRQRTNGHPLFVRECVLQRRTSADVDAARFGIPEGVREVVRQRLDRLPAAARSTLRCAAVLGLEFDVDVVAAMMQTPPLDVLSAVEEAMEAGLASEEQGHVDRFSFHHAIVREVVLDELTTSRRVRLEWSAGEAIETLRSSQLDIAAGDIARHLTQGLSAGDACRAAAWARRAGDHALETWAYEDAVRYYESALIALELATSSDEPTRIDVLISLGRAADRAGDRARCRSACEEAAAAARRARDPLRLGRAAIDLLGTLGPGLDHTVDTLLTEAAAELRRYASTTQELATLAELLARHSGYVVSQSTRRSARLADEALDAARRSGDDRALALALTYSTQGYTLDRSVLAQRLEEAERLSDHTGDRELSLNIQSALMARALTWGDRDQFDDHLAGYAEIAATMRAATPVLLSDIDHAGAATIEGRYQDAADQLASAERCCRRLADPALLGFIRTTELVADRELGRLGRQEHWIASYPQWPGYHPLLSHVLSQTGHLVEARRHLEAALARPAVRAGFNRRWILALLAESAFAVPDGDCAQMLLPWTRAELRYGRCVIVGPNGYFGALARYLGLLALTVGDVSAAVQHHRAALRLHQRMRAAGWTARSRYDLARALQARGRPGDDELAADHLDQARTAADQLGMVALRAELDAM